MIIEIQARTLLAHVKQPDPFFGLKYNMNLYRGCQHRCIYCDSRSECYQVENFDQDVLVKINAPQLLETELRRKRVRGTIGTGSMNDPYMPIEAERRLTGTALEIIARYNFPVHILTKSTLVLRDLNILRHISQVYAAVSFTITTADDNLGKKIEPGAPPVSERFHAMEKLAANGIYTGVTMMPILPFIEDNAENIRAIIRRAACSGAGYLIPATGVTLRDRQRTHFYHEIDRLFPGLRQKYIKTFGERYHCAPQNDHHLRDLISTLCQEMGLATQIRQYQPKSARQPELFPP